MVHQQPLSGAKWYSLKDIIDQYQPDLLHSDGECRFGEYGLNIISHLYNTSARLHGGVNQQSMFQKTKCEVYSLGVLDIERSQLSGISPHIWQTDTSVGDWFYNVRDVYKTPRHVADMLIDIVSKNGNLLLNIPQKPDGTLDDEAPTVQSWGLAGVNGEGLRRPWTRRGAVGVYHISGRQTTRLPRTEDGRCMPSK
jgi:alpha-L-fucosidase